VEDRRLAARRSSPTPVRPFAQPALVREDDRLALACGVVFTSGHRTRTQRRMAASSRSSARPVGR
jgi:hypothetical protein